MNVWTVIYRVAVVLFLVLMVAVALLFFLPRCRDLRDMNRRIAALQQETRDMEARIKELRQNQERFMTDPAFVEFVARGAGFAKPGEKVFKLTNDVPSNPDR